MNRIVTSYDYRARLFNSKRTRILRQSDTKAKIFTIINNLGQSQRKEDPRDNLGLKVLGNGTAK